MEKAKFQINGMHCHSCAVLIEEKLKNLAGVIKSKIDYESGKGVVAYDESAVDKTAIKQEVENIGDYQVEEEEEGNDEAAQETENEGPPMFSEGSQSQARVSDEGSEKTLNFLKLITGLLIVSLGMNAYLLIFFSKRLPDTETLQGQAAPTGQNAPANQPPPSQAQPTAIQTFEITKTSHIRGNVNAPVTLVEFSDFECPFCERHYQTLNKILSDYKDEVRLIYKHFPLGFHPNAQKAAEASECADEQGKFWGYHDKLFENLSTGYSTDKFKTWAKELGLNTGTFNNCLDSGTYAQKVQTDSQEGAQKGVQGTPATFVNGQLVSGALPYSSFKQTIDAALKR